MSHTRHMPGLKFNMLKKRNQNQAKRLTAFVVHRKYFLPFEPIPLFAFHSSICINSVNSTLKHVHGICIENWTA